MSDLLKYRLATRSGRRGRIVGFLAFLGTATQLRPGGAAGIFELLLLGYMAFSLPVGSWGLRLKSHRPGRFLLIFVTMTSIGGFYSVFYRQQDEPLEMIVAFMPYIFAIIAVEYCTAQPHPYRFLFSFMYTFGRWVLATQFVFWLSGLRFVGPLDLYLHGVRFQGWASNPNQIAVMLVLAVAAIGMTSDSRLTKAAAIAASLGVGFVTQSDAWRFAMVGAAIAVLVAALKIKDRIAIGYRVIGWSAVAAGIYGIVTNIGPLLSVVEGVAGKNDQGSGRAELWNSCIDETVGSGFGMVAGLGPTAHAFLDGESGRECHNTVLDMFTFGGFPVAIAFFAMFVVLFRREWTRASYWGIFALSAVGVQMTFSYVGRYPSLWIFLTFLALAPMTEESSEEPPKASPAKPKDDHTNGHRSNTDADSRQLLNLREPRPSGGEEFSGLLSEGRERLFR